MKFAAIVPIPMLKMLRTDRYHMVLAPQVELEQYRNFYRIVPGHKILDNGAAEGAIVDDVKLLRLANDIKADEVIAPDVMYDAAQTIRKLMSFCVRASEFDVKVMAVMQANDWIEFEDMVDVALANKVAALALPKLLTGTINPNARLVGAELIRTKTEIPIHCLGCAADIRGETRALAAQDIVRGIDTSAPVVMGLQGNNLTHDYDWRVSHKAIIDYWNQPSTGQVEANLSLFRKWCTE